MNDTLEQLASNGQVIIRIEDHLVSCSLLTRGTMMLGTSPRTDNLTEDIDKAVHECCLDLVYTFG